ncbi:MAG TPA: hypothetical protein VGI12_13275 [Vicinamibacterales bacterium]|jgi:hypothetical protein
MRWFGFLRRRRGNGHDEWQRAWEHAVDGLDESASSRLDAALTARRAAGDDLEMEDEMLQALHQVLALERELARDVLPHIETAHRVAAGERCHFSAPVAMPDDPAQPTGRLILTAGRAAFAGAGRPPALPWHATRQVIRAGRDLIFVGAGADDGFRFRCNSFPDALCGAAIARHLMRAARVRL